MHMDSTPHAMIDFRLLLDGEYVIAGIPHSEVPGGNMKGRINSLGTSREDADRQPLDLPPVPSPPGASLCSSTHSSIIRYPIPNSDPLVLLLTVSTLGSSLHSSSAPSPPNTPSRVPSDSPPLESEVCFPSGEANLASFGKQTPYWMGGRDRMGCRGEGRRGLVPGPRDPLLLSSLNPAPRTRLPCSTLVVVLDGWVVVVDRLLSGCLRE